MIVGILDSNILNFKKEDSKYMITKKYVPPFIQDEIMIKIISNTAEVIDQGTKITIGASALTSIFINGPVFILFGFIRMF